MKNDRDHGPVPFDHVPRPTEREGRNAPAPRILVVDDSPSARTILQDRLLRLGVALPDLRMAATIPEALEWFSQWNPELVFVDLHLRVPPTSEPRPPAPTRTGAPADPAPSNGNRIPRDGAELCLLLLGRNPALKVVICSAAEPQEPEIRAAARAGRVRVIVKPVMAAKVQEVLEAFRAPDRRRAGA